MHVLGILYEKEKIIIFLKYIGVTHINIIMGLVVLQ